MKLETLCLHGGHVPDSATLSRAVPVYRTASFVFKNTEHAANLFALKELGNILHRHILQSPAPVANNPDNAELPAQSMAVTLFS